MAANSSSLTGVPLDLRFALMRQHGTFGNAYSVAVQPGLEHFGDERGFLGYRRVGRTAIVLADPIAPPDLWADLIDRFVANMRDVCFVQASRPSAEILATRGFFINEMGPENRIELPTYTFQGRKKTNLRNAAHRVAELGYVTRECPASSLDPKEVKAVSDAWRSTRPVGRRETTFLNRPFVLDEEPDVRRLFTFDRSGRLMAFGIFDPIYENGEVVGYLSSSKRHRPEADLLVGHAITGSAIETFKKEGKKWLLLGLSPFAEIEDKDFEHNWLVRRSFRFVYENAIFNRYFYSLKGLSNHKRQYRGTKEQTYYAFNTLPSLPRILKLLRASSII